MTSTCRGSTRLISLACTVAILSSGSGQGGHPELGLICCREAAGINVLAAGVVTAWKERGDTNCPLCILPGVGPGPTSRANASGWTPSNERITREKSLAEESHQVPPPRLLQHPPATPVF